MGLAHSTGECRDRRDESTLQVPGLAARRPAIPRLLRRTGVWRTVTGGEGEAGSARAPVGWQKSHTGADLQAGSGQASHGERVEIPGKRWRREPAGEWQGCDTPTFFEMREDDSAWSWMDVPRGNAK